MTRILLFARLRDLAGTGDVPLDLPAGATVADLRHELVARHPALAGLLPVCAVGINQELARDEEIVPPDAEIAVLPPVSGG